MGSKLFVFAFFILLVISVYCGVRVVEEKTGKHFIPESLDFWQEYL